MRAKQQYNTQPLVGSTGGNPDWYMLQSPCTYPPEWDSIQVELLGAAVLLSQPVVSSETYQAASRTLGEPAEG